MKREMAIVDSLGAKAAVSQLFSSCHAMLWRATIQEPREEKGEGEGGKRRSKRVHSLVKSVCALW